jgi:hypothetical protein
MRLEHVCDRELVYREETVYSGKFVLVRPYGGEEGTGYGEGDGTVTGPQLRGTVRWVNHPQRRNDGTMVPDAHGVIVTDDHALMRVSMSSSRAPAKDSEASRSRTLRSAGATPSGAEAPAKRCRCSASVRVMMKPISRSIR